MTTPYFTNQPSTYGSINYGENLYGVTAVPAQIQTSLAQYLVEPFIAQSLTYTSIGVSWTKPQSTPLRWRLLSNRNGYPVDQNDGNVLLDSADWIGNFYLDTNVIPGTYHYYGIYAQTATNTWVRAGVTACLGTADSGASEWLFNHLPAFFTQNLGGNLTQDAAGNQYLDQFLEVLSWGIDYAQAQYDMLFNHLNDPMKIPLADLVNLAKQIGMPFDPMISVYLMRKAAQNWAHVTEQRGTPQGIASQLSLLTGYAVDLQVGQNQMLEQDQSNFPDPVYPAWNANTTYKLNEIVTSWLYTYQAQVAGLIGGVLALTWSFTVTGTGSTTTYILPTSAAQFVSAGEQFTISGQGNTIFTVQSVGAPSGGNQTVTFTPAASSSVNNPATVTTVWKIIQDGVEPTGLLTNSKTGGINTWEAGYQNLGDFGATSGGVGGAPFAQYASGTLAEGIGEPLPSSLTVWQANTLKPTNKQGIAQDMFIRSVARRSADIASAINANPGFVTGQLTPWTAGTGTTLGTSTVWTAGTAYPYSATITGNGVVASPGMASERFPLAPLTTYTAAVEFWSAQGWATCQMGFNFFDSAGTYLSSLTPVSVSVAASTPNPQAVNFQTPENTATATIYVQMIGTPPSSTVLNVGYSFVPRMVPDPQQAVNDGIPVPYTTPSNVWSSTVRYGTNAIVTYRGQAFIALRASTGATPPYSAAATPEWAPLTNGKRLRLMVSGVVSQNLTLSGSNLTVPVTPFVEWYDQWGNYIARQIARTSTTNNTAPWGNGIAGIPYNLALDSFVVNQGSSVNNRAFDNAYADQVLQSPAAPGTSTNAAGGSILAGTYQVVVAYVNTHGETLPSAATAQVTTGSTSTITITSPPASDTATGWYAYVSQAGGGPTAVTRQQAAGSPTAIGTNLTITTVTNTGAAPQAVNSAVDLPVWTANVSDFNVGSYAGGVAYPITPGTRAAAATNFQANGQAGLTIVTAATNGQGQGIVFRRTDDNNYWRANTIELSKKVAGVTTVVAVYSTAAQPGDRITVSFNGPAITAYLNGTQVATANDSFNSTAIGAGMIVE